MNPIEFLLNHKDLWEKDAKNIASSNNKTEMKVGCGADSIDITFFIYGPLKTKYITVDKHLAKLFNTESLSALEQLSESLDSTIPERIFIPREPFQINHNPATFALTIHIIVNNDEI